MRTIKVSELQKRQLPNNRGFDCFPNPNYTQSEVSCENCIFCHNDGCGGASYSLQWDKVKSFLSTQDGDYDLSIDDLALFVTGRVGLDVSGYQRD